MYVGILDVEGGQTGLTVEEATLRGVDDPVDVVVHAASGAAVLTASPRTVEELGLKLEPAAGKVLPHGESSSWYFLIELTGHEPGTYEWEGLELQLADAHGVVRPAFVPAPVTLIVEDQA